MVETEGLAFRSWRGAALGQRIWGGRVGWGALTDRAAHRGYGPRFPCQSPFSSSRSLGRQGGGGSMGHPRSVLTGAFLPPSPGRFGSCYYQPHCPHRPPGTGAVAVDIRFQPNAERPAGNDLPKVTWLVRAEPAVTS